MGSVWQPEKEQTLLLVVRPGAPSSFLLLLVRHLLLEAMHLLLLKRSDNKEVKLRS